MLPLPLAQAGQWQTLVDQLARTPLSKVLMFVGALTLVRLVLHPLLVRTPPHKRLAGYSAARFFNELADALVYAGVFVFLIIRPFGMQAFSIPSGSMWSTLHVNDYIVANKAVYRYSDPKVNDIVVFRPPVEAAHKDQIDEQGNVKVDFIKRCIGAPGDLVEIREGQLFRNGQQVEEPYKHLSKDLSGRGQYEELSEEEKNSLTKASFKFIRLDRDVVTELDQILKKGQIIPFNYTNQDANAHIALGNYTEAYPPYSVVEKYQIKEQDVAQELRKLPAEKIPPEHYLMMGDNRNNSSDGRAWGLVHRNQIVGRFMAVVFPPRRWGSPK